MYVSSVTQACPTLCDPTHCSMPGYPAHHLLPELAQTHVHWVGDAIQPSHPLSSSSLPAFNFSQHQGLFQCVSKYWTSFSASVFPMNIQDWFPLGLTGLISLQSRVSQRVLSNTTVQNFNSLAPGLLYGTTLTSAHGYWKNHSLNYTDHCWQSDVSAL